MQQQWYIGGPSRYTKSWTNLWATMGTMGHLLVEKDQSEKEKKVRLRHDLLNLCQWHHNHLHRCWFCSAVLLSKSVIVVAAIVNTSWPLSSARGGSQCRCPIRRHLPVEPHLVFGLLHRENQHKQALPRQPDTVRQPRTGKTPAPARLGTR